tara:strand:+ start:22993 stop:24417 length:1425 start_codon:yes stop_codon:yes gene_type:complete
MGRLSDIFKKIQGVPQGDGPNPKGKKKISPPNPFIEEVTMKGIKFARGKWRHGYPFYSSMELILPALDKRTYSRRNPGRKKKAKILVNDLLNKKLKINPHLQLLSSLDIVWPKEIFCPYCVEGTVPMCEECQQGSVECGECGGNWDQECGECGGDGSWTCEDCDGDGTIVCDNCEGVGTFSCDHCEGSGGIYCNDCGGEGCDKCSDGIIPCPQCESGVKICEECKGDGSLHCEECDGSGYQYCEYCEDGRWFCQECDEGSWPCDDCYGMWEEHSCEACAGEGGWNSQNSEIFNKFRKLFNMPLSVEDKKINLVKGYNNIAAEWIYLPPHWSKEKLAIALEKQEIIKNIRWRVDYYDAWDFNFKSLNINSYSILLVPMDDSYTTYSIVSSKLGGTDEYPTTSIPPFGLGSANHPLNLNIDTFKNNKNHYGEHLHFSYLKSPEYEDRKVILLRSDWYYKKPPFLNWLDDNHLMEKD